MPTSDCQDEGFLGGFKREYGLPACVRVSKVEPFSGGVGQSGECRLAAVCTQRCTVNRMDSLNEYLRRFEGHAAKGSGRNVCVGLSGCVFGGKKMKIYFFFF